MIRSGPKWRTGRSSEPLRDCHHPPVDARQEQDDGQHEKRRAHVHHTVLAGGQATGGDEQRPRCAAHRQRRRGAKAGSGDARPQHVIGRAGVGPVGIAEPFPFQHAAEEVAGDEIAGGEISGTAR